MVKYWIWGYCPQDCLVLERLIKVYDQRRSWGLYFLLPIISGHMDGRPILPIAVLHHTKKSKLCRILKTQ
jgi:hypothetical protein